jgi:hypothetical protein
LVAIGTDRSDLDAVRSKLAALGTASGAASNDPMKRDARSTRRVVAVNEGDR